MTDPYSLLGVAPDADLEAIKRAFRLLALALHPDMSDSPADHERFRKAREAYDILSDPDRRAAWDKAHGVGRGDPYDGGGGGEGDGDYDEDDVAREVGEDAIDDIWDLLAGRRPQSRRGAPAERYRAELVGTGEIVLAAALTRAEALTGLMIPFRWHLGPHMVEAKLRVRPGVRSGDTFQYTVPAAGIDFRVTVRVEVV